MTVRELTAMGDKNQNPIFGAYRRTADIFFRTVHTMSMSMLFGGHFFGATKERLLPFLVIAVLSGVMLILSSCHFDRYWINRVSGVAVVLKFVVLSLALVRQEYLAPILISAMLIGAIVSHAPSWFRNYMLVANKKKIVQEV